MQREHGRHHQQRREQQQEDQVEQGIKKERYYIVNLLISYKNTLAFADDNTKRKAHTNKKGKKDNGKSQVQVHEN